MRDPALPLLSRGTRSFGQAFKNDVIEFPPLDQVHCGLNSIPRIACSCAHSYGFHVQTYQCQGYFTRSASLLSACSSILWASSGSRKPALTICSVASRTCLTYPSCVRYRSSSDNRGSWDSSRSFFVAANGT